ncbi:hypothetical protein [Paenibacillus sp. FSL R7-0179]|uniref:hypothetical protein n=1 Tax=Paenibacillus sp. FSL R7-0179 TaxID=2921672 RepID=UPI0030F63D59
MARARGVNGNVIGKPITMAWARGVNGNVIGKPITMARARGVNGNVIGKPITMDRAGGAGRLSKVCVMLFYSYPAYMGASIRMFTNPAC